MILRVIRGHIGGEQLTTLRRTFDAAQDRASNPRGPARVHVGIRRSGADGDMVDAAILAFWRAFDDIARADKAGESMLALARDAGFVVEPYHFEVDETVQRRSDEEPVAIRIATGRFSKPGADIEMQDLLRQRVPLIGDDMTEAYVGRRLLDRSIDVTFVSAWRREPADRRLDETFWPDIALRYDSFAVEVFTPVR